MTSPSPASSRAWCSNEVAYRSVRHGVTQLLAGQDGLADTFVPACPRWTVRDLLAHLVEMSVMAVGRLGGGPAHPAEAAEPGLDQLHTRWTKVGEQLEQLIADRNDDSGSLVLMDAFTHELGLRNLAGIPPPTDHPAMPIALDILISGFAAEVKRRGLPALRIRTDGEQWLLGEGIPAATLGAGPYDLYRSLAGRRTSGQISELSWSGQPRWWLPAFTWGPFTPPARPSESMVGG